MGLFTSKEFHSIDDLLIDQMADLYDAEQRLTKALPKMAEAAGDAALKAAFRSHLKETEGHVNRLERAFKAVGKEAKGETCAAMKGLISEGEDVVNAKGDADVKDAALIAAAQRVEHYEIAAYGCIRNFALRAGHEEVARLMQETLDEEKHADGKLTELAEAAVNARAAV